MKSQLFTKRIPTLLGIGLIILGVVFTNVVVKNQTNLNSKASNSEEPQNIKVTNLSDDSFTITYQTDAAVTGSVNYGKNKELGNTELDDLDKEKGEFSPKNIHSITVKKLAPGTKYYLAIVSGQKTFLNNGIPFTISTASGISSPSLSQMTVQGKILLPDGNPPAEALVYLNTESSQLFSSLTAKDGRFNFSLKLLRSSDLSSYIETNDNTVLKLVAISNSLKSTVLASGNQANSIPTTTLSNDYDFTNKSVSAVSKSAEQKSIGFPSASPTQKITPAKTPTPTLTPALIPTPTLLPSPTPPPPTPIPTLARTPTAFIPITSKGGLPPTGDSSLLLTIGGVATAVTGIAILLLTHVLL